MDSPCRHLWVGLSCVCSLSINHLQLLRFPLRLLLCLLRVSLDRLLWVGFALFTMQISFSFTHTYSDGLNQAIHSMIYGGQGLWRAFLVCRGFYGGHLGMAFIFR